MPGSLSHVALCTFSAHLFAVDPFLLVSPLGHTLWQKVKDSGNNNLIPHEICRVPPDSFPISRLIDEHLFFLIRKSLFFSSARRDPRSEPVSSKEAIIGGEKQYCLILDWTDSLGQRHPWVDRFTRFEVEIPAAAINVGHIFLR